MNRRQLALCLVLLPSVCYGQTNTPAVGGGAWGIPWTNVPTVVVVSPDDGAQARLAREAVDFWNRSNWGR